MTTTGSSQTDWFRIVGPFLLGALLLALPFVAVVFVFTIPDRWDRATVVRICRDGTRVFRMEDGEYRVRYSARSFHAASADVCG